MKIAFTVRRRSSKKGASTSTSADGDVNRNGVAAPASPSTKEATQASQLLSFLAQSDTLRQGKGEARRLRLWTFFLSASDLTAMFIPSRGWAACCARAGIASR